MGLWVFKGKGRPPPFRDRVGTNYSPYVIPILDYLRSTVVDLNPKRHPRLEPYTFEPCSFQLEAK